MAKIGLTITLLLWCIETHKSSKDYFIVWNVGQGLWVTYITDNKCLHFDIGGEHFPERFFKICGKNTHHVFLSHSDWDHIRFLHRLVSLNTCLIKRPREQLSRKKHQFLGKLKQCKAFPSFVKEISEQDTSQLKNNNEFSRVFQTKKILLPGDSPIRSEKKWLRNLKDPQQISYLVLGHHGSQSSTSNELLNVLKNLKIAFASARKQKYGHPHIKVTNRLKSHHVPLLRTEAWGDIVVNL